MYELTSDQLVLWKRAGELLQKGWIEAVRKVHVDGGAAMNDLMEQLAKHNAGY
jgi:hypothetical protein